MCDLRAANLCRSAVEDHLASWSERQPGGFVLAHLTNPDEDNQVEKVEIDITSSFDSAVKLQRKLKAGLQSRSIIVELEGDFIMML